MSGWVERSLAFRETTLKKQQENKGENGSIGVSEEMEAKINGGLHPDLKSVMLVADEEMDGI